MQTQSSVGDIQSFAVRGVRRAFARRLVGALLAVSVGALTAVAVVPATPAAATVLQVSATPDMNAGIRSNYGTGCSHTVRARLDDAATPVTFYDNGVPFATVAPAGGGYALAKWVPVTEGDHLIQASQGNSFAPHVSLFVGRGGHIGYACWVV